MDAQGGAGSPLSPDRVPVPPPTQHPEACRERVSSKRLAALRRPVSVYCQTTRVRSQPSKTYRPSAGNLARGQETFHHFFAFSVLLPSLELSVTKVYETSMRARLETTAHFCKTVVLRLRMGIAPDATPRTVWGESSVLTTYWSEFTSSS